MERPFTAAEQVRHTLAKPNCSAARLMRLAPARRGEPGYHPEHDRDGDGWACEPTPRRRG
ncbi:excalibur calcium-binding domain-containing protein [Brevundimonas naejangsanensis]